MIIPYAISYLIVVAFQQNDTKDINIISVMSLLTMFLVSIFILLIKPYFLNCFVMAFASAVAVLVSHAINNNMSKGLNILLFLFCVGLMIIA